MLLYSATGTGDAFSAPKTQRRMDCLYDRNCADNEYCLMASRNDIRCVPVKCAGEAKVKKHKCVCDDGKIYADGKCIALKCFSDQDCTETEICVNPGTVKAACVFLNCPVDEKAENHACVPKKCEDIRNGYRSRCLPSEEEIYSDGDCVFCMKKSSCLCNADCDDDYACRNNQCELLSCPTCHIAKDHMCLKKTDCCITDFDCGENKKCAGGVCVEKTCAEIDPSYQTICEQMPRIVENKDTGITAADGRCRICGKPRDR